MESKLPDFVQRDWLIFMVGPSNNVTSDNHFDILLKFLKKHIIKKKGYHTISNGGGHALHADLNQLFQKGKKKMRVGKDLGLENT